MTRYVITSGHPNLHGTIGHWERYDSVGVVLGFKDEKGYLSNCSFPLDSVRELDDTPIAAGDEVCCIKACTDQLEVGQVVIAGKKTFSNREGTYVYFNGKSFPGCNWLATNFVKVKPLAEVKQEAAEPTRKLIWSTTVDGIDHLAYLGSTVFGVKIHGPESFHWTVFTDNGKHFGESSSLEKAIEACEAYVTDKQEAVVATVYPPTKREAGHCITAVGRSFWMVKGFGPTTYEHECADSADREAERLARENPGIPFTVLAPSKVFFNGMAKVPLCGPDSDVPF